MTLPAYYDDAEWRTARVAYIAHSGEDGAAVGETADETCVRRICAALEMHKIQVRYTAAEQAAS
jgi:hypothetical protein